MSRKPRAGTAGKPVTIRATADERASWERAAVADGQPNLSAWIVATLNGRVARLQTQHVVDRAALAYVRSQRRTQR